MGLIATNTIAQGDTREVGLDQLTASRFVIPRAVPSRPWPGIASLEIAYIWLRKGNWSGSYNLDDKATSGITAFLTEPGTVTGKPHRLKSNEGKSFQGSIVLGMGFVLSPEEAHRLISADARNKDVLFPYLNGKDLNNSHDQSPTRWVINFQDWPIEKAMSYHDAFDITEKLVKPERTRTNDHGDYVLRKPLPQKWWHYAEKRPALYRSISSLKRVIVFAQTSKTKYPVFTQTDIVFDQKTVVISLSDYASFAILCSHLHYHWVIQYGCSLRTDPVYTPTDCFETFPFPAIMSSNMLFEVGKKYDEFRQHVLKERQEGLTPLYNSFHNPQDCIKNIKHLRQLHSEMDQAVAGAYGWSDLSLGHDFHKTKEGIRFTISESARREVLSRLLALNHQRYAAEVAQGLHDAKKNKSSQPRKPKAASAKPLGGLFGLEES